jgi:hypothetical protein
MLSRQRNIRDPRIEVPEARAIRSAFGRRTYTSPSVS